MLVNLILRVLILRVLTAVALVGVAVVHLRIVDNYEGLGSHPLALADQFYAQSTIALLLALALLIRPHLLVWLAATGFAAGALAVLVYSRYRCLPIYGFDGCFQETWAVEGARAAAYIEGAALALSAAGAALTHRTRLGRACIAPLDRRNGNPRFACRCGDAGSVDLAQRTDT